MSTFIWELIARIYGYNAALVPQMVVHLYARVANVCDALTPAAHAFYAALGLC